MLTSLQAPPAQHHLSCVRPILPRDLSEGINRRFLEPANALIRRLSCFVFFVIWMSWKKESRALRANSHRAEEEWGSSRSARRAPSERHCRRYHRPKALRIASVCKEPLAAGARGEHYSEHQWREASLDLEVTQTGTPR